MIFPPRARVVATSGLPLSLLPELWLVEEMALVDDVDSNRRGSNLSVPQPGQFRYVLARHVEQPDLVLEEDPVECVAEAGPSIFVLRSCNKTPTGTCQRLSHAKSAPALEL